MQKRNKELTRKLILDTALDKFAEKGFDGASISQIAKAAKVNQALIYYYFENKQAIIAELLNEFIDTANSFLVEIAIKGYVYGSDEMEDQMTKYNTHILNNDKVLRLLITESMKDTYDVPPIFKLIDFDVPGALEPELVDEMNQKGFNFDQDAHQRRVTEFFTGIMPTIVYSLFRCKWSTHFNLAQGQLDTLFTAANDMTHNSHHQNEKKNK